jgi:hypothetical protein
MKTTKVLLSLSIVANIALAGYVVSSKSASSAVAIPASSKSAESGPQGSDAIRAAAARESWDKLADKDPAALVASLRAAGFPPKVLRAIMATYVNELFAERRKALMGNSAEQPVWKMKMSGSFDFYAKIQALQREQTQMLKQLLGGDYSAGIEENSWYYRHNYGNFSPEKLEAVQRLTSDYNELRYQIYGEANGVYLPEDREKLAMLDREQRKDLAAILSPGELLEFEMRSSNTAQRLRTQYSAFDFTEEEFNAVFNAAKEVDDKFSNFLPYSANIDSKLMSDRRAAEQKSQEAIKQALGDARYAELQRSANSYYRVASQIADRLQLSKESASAVYELSQTSEKQGRAIATNKELSQEARNLALQGLASDIDAKLNQILTPKGATIFKQSTSSGWQRYLPANAAKATTVSGSPGN